MVQDSDRCCGAPAIDAHAAETAAPSIRSIVLAIEPSRIALFKAVIESYDNLATLRTEDPRRHHLRLFFDASAAREVESLLGSLTESFGLVRLDALPRKAD